MSARFRAGPRRSYPAGYARRPPGGGGQPVPVSRRVSAAGIRFSVIRFPPRDSALLTVGLPDQSPDPDGVTAFRTHELRPGWVPSKPRGRRCSSRTEGRAQPAPAALPRLVLRPALAHPSCGLCFTRHQRGFTQFTRPACPSPVAAGMDRPPLGFPRSFTPRRPGADESRRGGARSSSTNLELHAQLTLG